MRSIARRNLARTPAEPGLRRDEIQEARRLCDAERADTITGRPAHGTALNEGRALHVGDAKFGHPGNDERVFMLSIIRDLAPRDAVERMLAVQMAATHVATIRSARWLANAETIPQVQAHYTGNNKLGRTFAAQIGALRRHRTGGKQTVVVQRMKVPEGGKAIVGNVQHGGVGQR